MTAPPVASQRAEAEKLIAGHGGRNAAMTFCEFILCCQLARAIHGTDDAIRCAARQCRDRVSREQRPLVSRIIRHPKINQWLDLYDGIQ